MDKATVQSVTIQRAEGKKTDDFSPKTFTGPDALDQAQHTLCHWGQTAPGRSSGYHKVDFNVVFTNGMTYKGRFDLQHGGYSGGDSLHSQVRKELKFWSGQHRPAHVAKDTYDRVLQRVPDAVETAKQLLDACNI